MTEIGERTLDHPDELEAAALEVEVDDLDPQLLTRGDDLLGRVDMVRRHLRDVHETLDTVADLDERGLLEETLVLLLERFAQVAFVPGNHDLWSPEGNPRALRGEAKYRRLVAICRDCGVLTPEDVADIQAYIIDRANDMVDAAAAAGSGN